MRLSGGYDENFYFDTCCCKYFGRGCRWRGYFFRFNFNGLRYFFNYQDRKKKQNILPEMKGVVDK